MQSTTTLSCPVCGSSPTGPPTRRRQRRDTDAAVRRLAPATRRARVRHRRCEARHRGRTAQGAFRPRPRAAARVAGAALRPAAEVECDSPILSPRASCSPMRPRSAPWRSGSSCSRPRHRVARPPHPPGRRSARRRLCASSSTTRASSTTAQRPARVVPQPRRAGPRGREAAVHGRRAGAAAVAVPARRGERLPADHGAVIRTADRAGAGQRVAHRPRRGAAAAPTEDQA